MNALSDPQLLRAFAERRSEAAFAELVRRHIDLVHSAALRMVNDPHLAKDVSQGVFVALAKDAGRLTNHPVLSGWLHRTARNIAAQSVRTDVRRRHREMEAAAMNAHPDSDASWQEIAPHLDAALADLSEPDRDAVLLRYFENKPAQEMAAILGTTAEAAQKRVSRAVERLRENFAKRGITAGAAGLATVISANAVQAAPIGLASTFSVAALASTAAATSAAITATQALAMTSFQKSLVATVVTLLAGFGIHQAHQASKLRQEVIALQQQEEPLTVEGAPQQTANAQNTLGIVRNHERLLRDNRDLSQRNAKLQKELDSMRRSLELTDNQSSFLQSITTKLASGDELQVPQSVPELAVFYGQVQMRSRNFHDKWSGRVPAEGTPEATEYQQDLDANITDEATLMKALHTLGDANFLNDPSSMAQFQSMQLYGALGLDESQWRELDESLNRFYTECLRRKLNQASRPETGLEAWQAQRTEIGQKAFSEIQAYFTPPQLTEFRRIYKPEFLWGLSVGSFQPTK